MVIKSYCYIKIVDNGVPIVMVTVFTYTHGKKIVQTLYFPTYDIFIFIFMWNIDEIVRYKNKDGKLVLRCKLRRYLMAEFNRLTTLYKRITEKPFET